MAKIEMDISEYEAMKENKRLLEDSLKNERGLQEEIKKLTDEKTKALEDAKMKVVKISKTEVTEHVLAKRDIHAMLPDICRYLGIDFYQIPHHRLQGIQSANYLIDSMFEKITSRSYPTEEVTTHGLDEISVEIRNDLKSKMDSETREKLEDAKHIFSRNNKLLKENKKLLDEKDSVLDINNGLSEECKCLNEELTKFEKEMRVLSKVREILKDGFTFWNKSELLNRIIFHTDIK